MKRFEYDADSEEPDCGRCENVNANEELCFKYCGAEHAWGAYLRYEYSEVEE